MKRINFMRNSKRKTLDPLQFEYSIGNKFLNRKSVFTWEKAVPTAKQLSLIDSMGIDTDSVKTAGQASSLISTLLNRSKAKLSTPKQIKTLERYGFKRVGKWTAQAATSTISLIAGNNWSLPRGIDAETYQPC
jgi:hypothetical protein